MRVLRLTCRALAYVTGGAVLAVVFSPVILVLLACLGGILALIAIVFGLALGLAAICAAVFHSLFGLSFEFWMWLTGTGAVAMTAYLLVSGFTDSDRDMSEPEERARSGVSSLTNWLISLWAIQYLIDRNKDSAG